MSAGLVSVTQVVSKCEPVSAPLYGQSEVHRMRIADQEFIVGLHEGYNVGGLIGTEYNGVFMISDRHKCIVFFNAFSDTSVETKKHFLKKLLQATSKELLIALLKEWRALPDIKFRFMPWENSLDKTPDKLRWTRVLKRRLRMFVTNPSATSYNAEGKAEFAILARAYCERLAKQLHLKEDQFSIVHFAGGIAGGGEVVLKTTSAPDVGLRRGLRFEISSESSSGLGLLWRRRNTDDLTSTSVDAEGINLWVSTSYLLKSFAEVAEYFKERMHE